MTSRLTILGALALGVALAVFGTYVGLVGVSAGGAVLCLAATAALLGTMAKEQGLSRRRR